MYSFSIVVIEHLYIQTNLMVALSLFRVKEGGAIYKSEVDINCQIVGKNEYEAHENSIVVPYDRKWFFW